MSNQIKNFVTIRKTKGDILSPATYRSVVEMILGIIKKYNYAGLNDSYKSFLAHLQNYKDPHKVTESGFLEEILTRTYAIYIQMTASPLSEEDFREQIVPSLAFLELIRRIVLNRYLYDAIKNPDGTVNASVSVLLTQDWNHAVIPAAPTTLTFSHLLVDEADFIAQGHGANSTPVPVIFNADNLTLPEDVYDVVFHTSTASPYVNFGGSQTGYIFSLFGASNDFTVDLKVYNRPGVLTSVFKLLNGTDTVDFLYSTTGTFTIKRNTIVVASDIACNDGRIVATLTRSGSLNVSVQHNGTMHDTSYVFSPAITTPLISGMVNVPTKKVFTSSFAIESLTVYTKSQQDTPLPDILPMVFSLPGSSVAEINATVSGTGTSSSLLTTAGYNLYLTLTGTWSGVVKIERSRDAEATWEELTVLGDNVIGVYTQNCDEDVLLINNDTERYRVHYALTAGSLSYRLAI